jgi:hypothetical protein
MNNSALPYQMDGDVCLRPDRRIRMHVNNPVIVLIVIGVLLLLVNTSIPMDLKYKNILNVVVVIAVLIWLLQALGVLGSLNIL